VDSLHFSDTFESVTDLFSICLKLGGFQNCLKKKNFRCHNGVGLRNSIISKELREKHEKIRFNVNLTEVYFTLNNPGEFL